MIKEHKQIDLFGKILFEKVIIKPPFKKPNPMSDEACFLHICEGRYHSFSEDDFLSVKKGQSVLMKCGNYLSRMIADENTGLYQAVAVHFHPEVLKRIYASDFPSLLTTKKKYNAPNVALVYASLAVDKYVDDILFYFKHPQLINQEILILKTKEIILLLMQTKEANTIHQILAHLFSPRIVDFKTIIEAHLFSDITLSELALLSNLSLSTFKRKFKEIYHTTPNKYIFLRRLEKSKELLTKSDYSITKIAYDCGFKTMSHFSKKFKETYQISPSVFRLNHSTK